MAKKAAKKKNTAESCKQIHNTAESYKLQAASKYTIQLKAISGKLQAASKYRA